MNQGHYFDHNASAPMLDVAQEAMLPWLGQQCNPSALHQRGRMARQALEQARASIAELIGTAPNQVIFTSGGTESNNLALYGLCQAQSPKKPLWFSALEHPSVRQPILALKQQGWAIHSIPATAQGQCDLSQLPDSPAPYLASMMLANNETGVLQPVADLARQLRPLGGWLHCDACQAAGRIPINWRDLGVHLLSLSAHKMGGPLGIGALIMEPDVPLMAQHLGGGHERGLRSGTEPVALAVGFAAAADWARTQLAAQSKRQTALRDLLQNSLQQIAGVRVFGTAPRLPNTLYLAIEGLEGATAVMQLDQLGFAVSSGSSCSSASQDPSTVLGAMGVPRQQALCSLRISLGPINQRQDVDALLQALTQLADQARTMRAAFA